MGKKNNNFKPGDLVELWDEELKYMGVGIYMRPIDFQEEWDMSQGGDCWVFTNGSEYVFWYDELEHIDPNRKVAKTLE